MFYVCQFRFRVPSHHRLLIWTSLLLILLHLIPAITMLDGTTDTQIVQDIKEGKRNFLVMGVVKSRFVVMVGNSSPIASPADDFYVFDMSPSAFTANNKLYLHNGTALKDKWPVLYEWWKKELQSEKFRLKQMLMSDAQHEYMVVIAWGGEAYSYAIDTAALGDKVLANKRYLMNNIWLTNTEPMTAYFREIIEENGMHTTKPPPNGLGDDGGESKSSNFHVCKSVFSNGATYPEANWSEDDGGVYLCKSTDGQLLVQTGACKTPLDWDVWGGFVDGERVVEFDYTGSTVHVFPQAALVRQNGNKTFKLDNIEKRDFVEAGEPREGAAGTGHSGLVIGLVVGLLVLLLIIGIVAFVVFYFCYVKPAKPKAGSTPRGLSSKKRLSTGRGKQSRHGRSKKRATSLKRASKRNRQRSSSKRRSSKRNKK